MQGRILRGTAWPAPFVLGLSGKSGSGFDTDCAAILARRGFALVRATDQADRAWATAAVRRRMAALFPEAFAADPGDPSGWTRRPGVLGALVADDAQKQAQMAAVLRPYLAALVAQRLQEAIDARRRWIAVLAETLVSDSLYCLCHAAWFVDRPDHERTSELARAYRERPEIDAAYIGEKVQRIEQWNRDVVVPGGPFTYDLVLEHKGDVDLLESQMTRALEVLPGGAVSRPIRVRRPEAEPHPGPPETLLLNARGRHGQFVRSALGLAQHARRPIRLRNVAGLAKRGCRRDVIVASAQACAQLFGGRLAIDEDAGALDYDPGDSVRPTLEWEVPANTPLGNILQTALPSLLCGSGKVELVLRGATELNHGTPMVYYRKVLFPLLSRMGARIEMDVRRHGFFDGPPGELLVRVEQVPALRPLVVLRRGAPRTLTLSLTVTASLAASCRSFPVEFESFCRQQGCAGEFRLEQTILDHKHAGFAMSAILETEQAVLGADVGCDLARERTPEGLRQALDTLKRRTRALLEAPAALDIMCADKILAYLAVGGGSVTVPLAEDVEHLYGQIGLINGFGENAIRVVPAQDCVQLDCRRLS